MQFHTEMWPQREFLHLATPRRAYWLDREDRLAEPESAR